MPIRERARALFKTKSKSDRGSPPSSLSSAETERERWPSNVYKPGEPMPRLKYRAPPKKEHKEKLEAFSFADAWRRKSWQSQHSPMGTRAPSRRNSWFSVGRPHHGDSRKGSVTYVEDAAASKPTTLPELDGDDDVGNVGLSRVQSADYGPRDLPSSPKRSHHHRPRRALNAHDHTPFSEKDFSFAMHRSRMAIPTH